MKTKLVLLVTVGLLFFQINMKAQSAFKIKTATMTVQGTSSLHDWESTVENIECKGLLRLDNNNLLTDIERVDAKILVESIKSTKGKIMDNKTYEAFNSEKFPHIIYNLISKKIDATHGLIETKGNLTMAGVTKPIDMLVRYKTLPGGDIQFVGSKKIKMTDFKMEPPTAVMGTIKVGDEVTVYFEITVTPNKIIQ
jgi:hypothetical protein